MLLSVVIPCYNEEDNVELFYDTIVHVFGNLMKDTELIFVNDGSRDETFRRLENIYKNSPYQIKVWKRSSITCRASTFGRGFCVYY